MGIEMSREDMDLLAAEYVVGLLDGQDREAARDLIVSSGTMRQFAAMWVDRFAPLNAGYAALPAPDVWPALDGRLFQSRRKRMWLFFLILAGLCAALMAKVAFWLTILK